MPETEAQPRWTLSRAGIVNVYQYEEETLHFRGGRLLLRGVNGSGKSTAMNMLLPFLIDADPRRIDAAGQQTGVLASWMLTGRDETQPVGYLWLEFCRGGESFVCGCGIRANRNTKRVTTWWFATDQRPGVDFALVERRVPRSAESLRATLGPGAVFADDQRAGYRTAVRRRLFGGADLDQHLSLLHIVRSPRVGDQIERDLPEHLVAALPELSEVAVADAAQPLDDLDDHRRNVDELSRTATALAALTAVYQRYARGEVRRRAADALQDADVARRAHQAESAAAAALTAAEAEHRRNEQRIGELELRRETLDNELRALHSSDAYRAGANLVQLRERVASLAVQVGAADATATGREQQRRRAATATSQAAETLDGDLEALRGELDVLAALAHAVGLGVRPPDVPTVQRARVDGEADIPEGPIEVDALIAGLAGVRAAGQQRRVDVTQIRTALTAVGAAEADLGRARRDETAAAAEMDRTTASHDAARVAFDEAGRRWAASTTAWLDGLSDLGSPTEIAALNLPRLPPVAAMVGERDELRSALFDVATALAGIHASTHAAAQSRVATAGDDVATAERELAELEARREPEAPRAPWQRAGGDRLLLTDVLDFGPAVGETERAGLEAAMEAAGLLGAEVVRALAPGQAATLVLTTGELVAVGGPPVQEPLSTLLDVVTGDTTPAWVRPAAEAVLATISTSIDADSSTVVTVDGTFRLGVLQGRHTKHTAEYIGSAARRALLERQRAAARAQLTAAREALTAAETVVAAERARLLAVEQHRSQLPALRPVDIAEQAALRAGDALAAATTALAERRREVAVAETRTAEAAAELHRRGATLQLPTTADRLADIDDQLARTGVLCDRAGDRVGYAQRSFTAWSDAVERWRATVTDHADSLSQRDRLQSEHQPLAMQLATLEDSVGLEYGEVLRAIETSEGDLREVKQEERDASDRRVRTAQTVTAREAALASARDERSAADDRCIRTLRTMRRVIALDGLLAAAQIDPTTPIDLDADEAEAVLPTVAESVDGLRVLARAVLASVPAPTDGDASADSVRQSLRQRRDSLAAGWDAEDRQPDPDLPMTVQVVGPTVGRVPLAEALTRVSATLRDQESLLTHKQTQALRNLLQGLVAREVAERLLQAHDLVAAINRRLETVTTAHGVGVRLRWRRRDDLEADLVRMVDLLAMLPDLRTPEQDEELSKALAARLDEARRLDGDASYRELIARVLDYRDWFDMDVLVRRAGHTEGRLTRRTPLSEGEKKLVTYLPLFAAVAASCDGLARHAPGTARFLVLDDAFAKVSEDNHAGLFGLLVRFDLDFIATSERLWGTHDTVPSLAITEVIRDADAGVILLEHSTWDGHTLRTGT